MGGTDTGDLGYMINDFAATAIATDSSQQILYQNIRSSFDDYRFPMTIPSYSYFYDLYEFMNAVNINTSIDSTVKPKALAIMNLILGLDLVKYSFKGIGHTGLSDANGISIYIGNTTTAYTNNHDLMSGSTSWDNFLEWVGF